MLQRLGCTVLELTDGDEVEPLLLSIGQLHAASEADSADYSLAVASAITGTPPLLTAGSGTATGSALASHLAEPQAHFDLIVLDIQMKRMNGDEVCRRLRELRVPVVIVAATGKHWHCRISESSA